MMLNLNRKWLEKTSKTLIKTGSPFKPDLYRIEINNKIITIKDIYHKNLFYRFTIGPLLIKKEWNIYQRLSGIKGIPKVFGRIDRFAFSMEYIQGREIRRNDNLPNSFFNALEKTIEEIHSRGVVHLDLRHKGNILVNEEGNPFLIDFNSGFYFKEKGFFRRLLFPIFAKIDYGGFLKLKKRVSPLLMTAEEISFLKKIDRWRRLWIFN